MTELDLALLLLGRLARPGRPMIELRFRPERGEGFEGARVASARDPLEAVVSFLVGLAS